MKYFLCSSSFAPSSGEDEELGPPPSVDEAADALMTRLSFLLGEKIIIGEPGSPYHAQDDGQVIISPISLNVTGNLSEIFNHNIPVSPSICVRPYKPTSCELNSINCGPENHFTSLER